MMLSTSAFCGSAYAQDDGSQVVENDGKRLASGVVRQNAPVASTASGSDTTQDVENGVIFDKRTTETEEELNEAAKPVEQKPAAVAVVSADEIKQVGPDTYEISRAALEVIRSNRDFRENRSNPDPLNGKWKFDTVPKLVPRL